MGKATQLLNLLIEHGFAREWVGSGKPWLER